MSLDLEGIVKRLLAGERAAVAMAEKLEGVIKTLDPALAQRLEDAATKLEPLLNQVTQLGEQLAQLSQDVSDIKTGFGDLNERVANLELELKGMTTPPEKAPPPPAPDAQGDAQVNASATDKPVDKQPPPPETSTS